jgi:hypothetical protein
MIKHSSHPEPWDTEGAILNFLDITRDRLKLLEVLIIKLLSTGLIDLDELLLWCLSTSEDLITLLVHFLVEGIVFEFESTVKCLFFLINFALSIL